jgi:glycosyltransferase involved in cell wall biosynthesis
MITSLLKLEGVNLESQRPGMGFRADTSGAPLRRILYVQFTDPVAYPPLEHSSNLLAERDWEVLFLGTGNMKDSLQFGENVRIRVKSIRFVEGGARQKLQYLLFFAWVLYRTFVWRPRWIYASDPLSSPVVWFVRKFTKVHVIYHEHDSPKRDHVSSRFMRWVLQYRDKLAKEAELCVIPQAQRLLEFVRRTGRNGSTFCVWNCPQRNDVQDCSSERRSGLTLHYHGSINRLRLPPQLIVAACRFKGKVRLRVAGYEAIGSVGFLRELTTLAAENGVPELIEVLGAIPFRKDLLRMALVADVGLSIMPKVSEDDNLKHMVGASNKPFDCMACGLPLLVTNQSEWVTTFVETGYARACDPDDPDSIEAELSWYLDHPEMRREMGRRCKDKIRQAWNYENMFAPVLTRLENCKGIPLAS